MPRRSATSKSGKTKSAIIGAKLERCIFCQGTRILCSLRIPRLLRRGTNVSSVCGRRKALVLPAAQTDFHALSALGFRIPQKYVSQLTAAQPSNNN